jgi:PhnB protein
MPSLTNAAQRLINKTGNMQLIPYLVFNGNCEAAINAYAAALNGQVAEMSRFGDVPGNAAGGEAANRILHALLVAGDIRIMFSDAPPDQQEPHGSGCAHLSISFDDAAKQTAVFEALSEGATISMPLQDTFWGARFGMLTDRFGVKWMVNYDYPKTQES